MPTDHDDQTALFRYRVIAEAISPRLTPSERGLLVRELSARSHELPDGGRKEFSRATIDRWLRAYRQSGLVGLRPQVRSDQGVVRKLPELLEEACQLRREAPFRSAEQISRMLHARHGVRVSPRTIAARLRRLGLNRARLSAQPRVFGRFQAERCNELWVGDVLVGPFVPHPRVEGSRRAYLFLLVDDFSRLVLHGRWVAQENTRAGQNLLREAILARGLPEILYFDNGAPFANAALERTCAVLGIRLIHSRPGQPAGRGKVERVFRFIREAFLTEAELASIASFAELNDRFTAWVEMVCNTRVHSETNETPSSRYQAGAPTLKVDLELLQQAFRWSALRNVTRTAQVSLDGNQFTVDAALCGYRVELRYDPEDLASIEIWYEGSFWGTAAPFTLGRQVHRQVPQTLPPPPDARPSGVEYLGAIERRHLRESVGKLAFRDIVNKESKS